MRYPILFSICASLSLLSACREDAHTTKFPPDDTVHPDTDDDDTDHPDTDDDDTGHPDTDDRETGEPAAPVGMDERPSNTTCLAGPRPADGTATLALEPLFEELTFSAPVAALRAPGDEGRWYVVELKQQVQTFLESDPEGTLTPALEVAEIAVTTLFEWGLLAMALHPNHPTDPRAFLYYTIDDGDTALSSIDVLEDGTLDSATLTELIVIDQRDGVLSHVGAHIAFHPTDGSLWLALGDGGDAGEPDVDHAAQDTTDLRGSILRIDIDRTADSVTVTDNYGVPADNPFADGRDGRPEIYAWGFRNPWRFSFDQSTGDLWVGDVGQNCWEEIDRVELGGNYGWSLREGAHAFDIDDPAHPDDEDGCGDPGDEDPDDGDTGHEDEHEHGSGIVDPVLEYLQADSKSSVTGGFVYRGSEIPALYGTYVYADYVSGRFWGLDHDDDGDAVGTELLDTDLSIVSFSEDQHSELVVVAYAWWTGALYRLVAADQTDPTDPWPDSLIETGCVNPDDPTQRPEGAIPYTVKTAQWADGAEVSRWMALPDGQTIRIDADGDWQLPPGSVVVQNLSLDGSPVETRVLAHHDDGSTAGYTYAWNADATDATLVTGGRTDTVDGQHWRWPAANECLSCHSDAAGRTLGLETAQLNGDLDYDGLVANQLATLQHIGLFTDGLGAEAVDLPTLHGIDQTAVSSEDRARSYLHANCSGCHRLGATGRGPMDFRYTATNEELSVCGIEPEHGTLGIEHALLVSPGDPDSSVLSRRMDALDAWRMPSVGSSTVDAQAVAVIDDWIRGLDTCP
jgi:uncharacterized repeat protein (TIGR03806 family)